MPWILRPFADDVADAHPRVERADRVLEDDLHVLAHLLQRLPLEADHVDAVEADLACRRLEQPQQRASERRLAAAGLADEAYRLARIDVEIDAVDGLELGDGALQHPLLDREVLPHPLRREQDIARRGQASASPPGFRALRSCRPCSRGSADGLALARAVLAEPAGGLLRADLHEHRVLRRAAVEDVVAARREPAACGPVERARHHAADRLQRGRVAHAEERDRLQQRLRVRMLRAAEDVGDGPSLDDPARVHDRDLVDHLGDHAEVVGDQQDRHAEPLAQLSHQLEDLGLDRRVERGRRLVGDQELRVAAQRHRDHHALPHASRHLVRVVVHPPLG